MLFMRVLNHLNIHPSSTRKILIAVTGMSPAILTETVWALSREKIPVIPDEVVAITTVEGKKKIDEQLFGELQVWNALRNSLGEAAVGKLRFGADASIQVIGDGNRNFVDIATPEENEQAADFILKVLRQYSEDTHTQLIASIAGGRKSMSALMMACMSLIGREQDRVCHVLACDDFIFSHDNFFYPQTLREIKESSIRLSDIPFIRVRAWYRQQSGEPPASYRHMVSLFRQQMPQALPDPQVVLDANSHKICIGDASYLLDPAQFVAVWTFWKSRMAGDFCDGLALVECVEKYKMNSLSDPESFSKRLSAVKSKVKKWSPVAVDRLFPGIKKREFNYSEIRLVGHLRTSQN